jgi:hypothetical protein
MLDFDATTMHRISTRSPREEILGFAHSQRAERASLRHSHVQRQRVRRSRRVEASMLREVGIFAEGQRTASMRTTHPQPPHAMRSPCVEDARIRRRFASAWSRHNARVSRRPMRSLPSDLDAAHHRAASPTNARGASVDRTTDAPRAHRPRQRRSDCFLLSRTTCRATSWRPGRRPHRGPGRRHVAPATRGRCRPASSPFRWRRGGPFPPSCGHRTGS